MKPLTFEALGMMKDDSDIAATAKVAVALVTAPISIIAATLAPEAALATTGEMDESQSSSDVASALPRNQSVHTVASGESLDAIAKAHGMGVGELKRINELSDAALLLPGQVLKLVSHAVQPQVLDKTTAPMNHIVKAGETLAVIASRYSLSLQSLLALNSLTEKSLIFPGQNLKIRTVSPSSPKSSVSSSEHMVADGETLVEIAKQHRVSLTALLKANKLTKTSLIFVGQILELPSATDAPKALDVSLGNVIGKPTSVCIFHGFHKIRAGETISKIAAIYGVTAQGLLFANNLNWNSTIFIGQKIVIPTVHSALTCPKLTPLNDEMKQNAEEIIRIGRELSIGDYGIVIALSTAMQESSLRNIGFGDRDSVGLFQQRPSAHWGSKEQILNTEYSIRAFFGGATSPTKGVARGLMDIKNWQQLSVTEAAQAVQISAHPAAYAKWEPSAWNWLTELDQLEDS